MSLQRRRFMILEFTRSPFVWLNCLQTTPELASCRHRLEAVGHTAVLDKLLVKVFVSAEDLLPILAYLDRNATFGSTLSKLRPRHIITDERHYAFILSAVESLQKRHHVKQSKNPTSFDIDVPVAEIRDDLQFIHVDMIEMPPWRIPAYETLPFDLQVAEPAKLQWHYLPM
jgi:hypothetical protein